MAENDPKPTVTPSFMQAAAQLRSRIAAFARMVGTEYLAAKIPQKKDQRFAINPVTLLNVVGNSFRAANIDLYQAALLLEINCNRGHDNGVDHPLRLIELHNNDDVDFSHKTGSLLQSLMKWGYSYDDFLKSGILKKPSSLNEDFTLEDIYEENGIRLAEPEAPHTNGDPRDEVVAVNLLAPHKKQKTFSAIPKPIFLKLITTAMSNGDMNYMQATMMLSVNCHSLETRRKGQRYIDHTMGVAHDPKLNKDQRFIALIHDVIENSNITLEDLRNIGLPGYMIDAVDGITIRADEKEDYESIPLAQLRRMDAADPSQFKGYYSFIERCSRNMHSSAVKCADIRHNMRDAKPHKMLEYSIALGYLEAVTAGEIKAGSSLRAWAMHTMPEQYAEVMTRKLKKLADAIEIKSRGPGAEAHKSYSLADFGITVPPPLQQIRGTDIQNDGLDPTGANTKLGLKPQ